MLTLILKEDIMAMLLGLKTLPRVGAASSIFDDVVSVAVYGRIQ